jgi:hypothetical protein
VRARFDRRVILAVALAVVVFGWVPSIAQADLYWVGGPRGDRIGRADIAGTEVDASFILGLRDVGTLAVDRRHLYWTSGTAIGRANLRGGAIDRAFISGLGVLNGVAVAGRYVYWLSDHNPACGGKPGFGRARLNGTGLLRGFVCGGGGGPAIADAPYANGLGVTSDYLYWSWIGGIGRLNLQRRVYDSRFIVLPSGYTAAGVTAAGDHIYWGSYDLGPVIGRANLDGRKVDTTFIDGLAGNIAPEVSGFEHRLYFSNDYGSIATIARSTLTGVVEWDFVTGLHVVGDLTVGPS